MGKPGPPPGPAEILIEPPIASERSETPLCREKKPLHRLRISRIAVASLAVPALLVAGYGSVQQGNRWLSTQSRYQVPFDAIEIEPEIPAELRLGRRELLEQVRLGSGRGPVLPILQTDLNALARDFGVHSPWVASVESIERSYPARLRLQLHYRKPVARVEVSPTQQILLDVSAVTLPVEDVIPNLLPKLVLIEGLPSIVDYRPGYLLRGADGTTTTDLAQAATVLANFLREMLQTAPERNWTIRKIHVRFGRDRLYLQTSHDLWVLWGPPPGPSAEDRADADRRWKQLSSWIETTDVTTVKQVGARLQYLELGPKGPRLRSSARGSDIAP
jgi:hypothetical protein